MKRFIFLCLMWAMPTTLACAMECPVGYEPSLAVVFVQVDDIKKMGLADADSRTAEEKLAAFQAREAALQTEFRDKDAEFAMMLAEQEPNRAKVDSVATRLIEIIQEISNLRVTYAIEMTDFLKAANVRKVKVKPHQRSSRCDVFIAVPQMKRVLTGKEREIIGITEDEIRYLNDFEHRDVSFRADQQNFRVRLDRALHEKNINRTAVQSLLDEWSAIVRQQVINRLDRYFYADQVLFSSGRMEKLNAYYAKHLKHAKSIKPQQKSK